MIASVRRALQASRRAPDWPPLNTLFWWSGVRGLVRLFLKLAYRIRVEGAEHVPRGGPIIYVANHQSHFDPCIVGVLVGDRPLSGMARSTLFRNPLLAWIMRSIGVISLDQSKGDAGAFKAALQELAAGRCVLIFPEGSRTPDGAVHEFQPGAALLIKRSGAPVVPVALEGAFDIWPIGTPLPKLTGRLAVRAAPAMAAGDLLRDGPAAALRRLQAIVDGMRLDLRDILRRESGGKYPPAGPGDAAVSEHQRKNPNQQSAE